MSSTAISARALRLGTRGSKLARWQADWVAEQLRMRGHTVEIIEISTRGDAASATPIGDIGTGVFTKEIQRAVVAGDVDVAVHSLKDLPTERTEGLMLAAVPSRESVADALVVGAGSSESESRNTQDRMPLSCLAAGATIGTGSIRRQAQLLHARPDLKVQAIRGNVDTRLAKLDAGEFDALVLAEAGLKRLGLAARISEVLPLSAMLPAVGQGALGIECRIDDAETQSALAAIDDVGTHSAVLAERAVLAHLRGGCLAPVGGYARIEKGRLSLQSVVLSADGRTRLAAEDWANPNDAQLLGFNVAEQLLAQGAAELIAGARV